jgi:hypothetical protein
VRVGGRCVDALLPLLLLRLFNRILFTIVAVSLE